jgi:asparagine synthase (glutamine-hydrolysing)
MCGICGIINFDGKPVPENHLRKMMQTMKHRGPDDDGIFVHKNVGLGFVRLSIIDLSTAGHQPMISGDGRFTMVFNGEIYNYIELRKELENEGIVFITKTDSEVLLASYIHWGKECLHHFNGMWAFAIFDKDKNELFAARDRYGIKPFYYYIDRERFIFASEIPPIIRVLNKKIMPDEQVIYEYLVFNRTDLTESTFFESIKKLHHGHQLTIKENSFSIDKWYDLRSNLKTPFQSPEEFRDTLSSSIGFRLRSDVPVGICLSGGLDSSSIVSILQKDFSRYDINTFSAVYGQGKTGDESEYIDIYRSSLPNMHYIQPTAASFFSDLSKFTQAHCEPIPSASPYAQYKVMEIAGKHVVVTLDGQGADEELAGYHYFYGFYFKELLTRFRWDTLIKESAFYFRNQKSLFGFSTFLYFLLPDFLKNNLRVMEKGYLQTPFAKKYADSNSVTGNLYSSSGLNDALINHFEYKLEHLLKWEDRSSMYFSLEARVPFLDYRLVERTLSLAPDSIIRNGTTKYIMREAMKGTLPEQIRTRNDKIGFDTPAEEWFREKIFYDYLEELLLKKDALIKRYIDTDKAWSKYQRHLKGNIDIAKEIWKWINLEIWLEKYIRN